MSMTAEQAYIAADQVTGAAYATIAITSIFCLSRFGIQVWKQKTSSASGFQLKDFFVLVSWLSFLALAINTIVVTPAVYRVASVMTGESRPYPAVEQDTEFQLRISFANPLLLWLTLWAVKASLLCLFRRLLKRLSSIYRRWWWAVAIFAVAVTSTRDPIPSSMLSRC